MADLADIASGARWQPIDDKTMPPRGRIVLLWAKTSDQPPNWRMGAGCWTLDYDGDVEWRWDGYRLRAWDLRPTHWMPLPPPPGSAP